MVGKTRMKKAARARGRVNRSRTKEGAGAKLIGTRSRWGHGRKKNQNG